MAELTAHRTLALRDAVAKITAVEQLYREIRALRIYEGATEVQQLIIGRELLRQQG